MSNSKNTTFYTPERDKPLRENKGYTYAPEVIWKVINNTHEVISLDPFCYFLLTDEGRSIYPDYDRLESREMLITILNDIFASYYIENLSIDSLTSLLYDFDEYKAKRIQCKLWNSFKVFNEFRRSEYEKLMITKSDYKWQVVKVDCTFNKIFVEDERWKEVEFNFRFEEFVAFVFRKWTRFWLEAKEIHRWLGAQYYKGTIAKPKWPSIWKSSNLEVLIDIEPHKTPIENSNKSWSVNIKKYRCTFPTVDTKNNWWMIALKTKETIWKHWMDIDGCIIEWLPWEDKYDLKVLVWEWTYYTEDEKTIQIKASSNWFVDAEMDYWAWGTRLPRKLKVSESLTYRRNIWPETWSLEILQWKHFILEDAEIKHDYELIANNVTIRRWNVCGTLISEEWDIHITWNVISWTVIAKQWKVVIDWKVLMWSYIESTKWSIEATYCEFSKIVGKSIFVKHLAWCNVIWEEVTIWISNANNFIIKRSLSILEKMQAYVMKSWDMQTNWRDTKIILLAKREVIWDLKLQRKIKKAIAYHESMKNIDTETLRIIEELNKKAANFMVENKEEQTISEEKIFLKLNAWEAIWYTKLFLWDFEERFELDMLNSRWDDYKAWFISWLLDLFDNTQKAWKILLSEINIEQFSDESQNIDMSFKQIKRIMEDEFAKHKIPENTYRYREWIENRSWFRLSMLDLDEFKQMKLDTGKNHINMPIHMDEFVWSIRNISSGWLCLFIFKSEIKDDHIFYMHWDVADVQFSLAWVKFFLKMVIRCRIEDAETLTIWWQFIWINRWMEDKISKSVNDMQRLLFASQMSSRYEDKYNI